MKKLRVGQIGTLHDHAISAMGAIRELSDYFEVVGYVPESNQRYEEIKNNERYKVYDGVKAMSFDELFEEGIDVAVIEGFEKDLVKDAQKCIDRGIHVHIDKPAGANAPDFEKLLKDAKAKNLVVHMGYMYRYNKSLIKAKKLVEEGKLGNIYCIEAHMDCDHNLEKRQWLGNFKGGMMFFLGCHLVDVIYSILGVPEEIIPYNRAVANEIGAEDFGMAIFKYKDGTSFAKTCAAESGGFMRRQVVICGTKGTIEINPIERYVQDGSGNIQSDMRVTIGEEMEHSWTKIGEWEACEPADRYKEMFEEFAKCVLGEIENPYSYGYELRLQMLVLKACGEDIDFKRNIEL